MSKHHDHHDHDHGHDHHGHDHAPAKAEAKTKSCGHDHGHDHGHGGHHHHHGDPNTMGRAFAVAIVLNTAFVAIEFFYGFLANSTALMADAGHNLSDVLGLMLAWGAAILAKRVPNGRYTYGLRSTSMLAALFNSMLLMAACGAIAWEAVQQLVHPEPVAGLTVSVVAGVGILVNGFSAWLFMSGSKDDINVRGAYLHMAADAAISLGVLVAGVIVRYTGWNWLDPLVSAVIVAIIVYSTWSLLKQSMRMMLAAVPDNLDHAEVEQFLRAQPGVTDVHDVHIWSMSTTENALTAQLVTPAGHPGDAAMDAISAQLKEQFSIDHSTLQVRLGTTAHECSLQEPAH
ncbi:cation transporter [Duganella sp. BJB488]|uniref:cation diffusion facilitator family transporter n=1 Tax=unclassified Duganella TaxID=2636909 RepID=UPI000E348710|nr:MULTISPECIES: cation diffusion facilitator family transporter [unclassified Duganella]NVD69124.1 cation transporter [Duganella sp. BJB1802]RFP16742.1 cation transporter [Duganella sp. BJB489]RFP20836.1 cation transporter [Duganella sp. BJB488]RFP32103.1 cation transporter [Duganella sp. BJB480]